VAVGGIRAKLRQEVATDRWGASTEIRKASRARAPDSPCQARAGSPNGLADGEYSGSTHRDLFHDYFDARGRAARYGVSIFVKPIERGDVVGEGFEYFGVFTGAV
jgi:hypothetical protein